MTNLKKIIFLGIACLTATLGYAIENSNNQNNPSSENQQYDAERREDRSDPEIAQDSSPKSNPRWYKSREGRQEYLQGGGDYPRGQSQYSVENDYQNPGSSSNDSRWYKSREGR